MNKIVAGCMLVLTGLFSVYGRMTENPIKSHDDIYELKGNLLKYSFHDGTRGSRYYTFRISNYDNDFQLSAEILNMFDAISFKALNPGDEITVGIAKSQKKYLNNYSKNVFVFSLRNDFYVFLNENDSITELNSNMMYWLAFVFILVGIVVIIWGVKVKHLDRDGNR